MKAKLRRLGRRISPLRNWAKIQLRLARSRQRYLDQQIDGIKHFLTPKEKGLYNSLRFTEVPERELKTENLIELQRLHRELIALQQKIEDLRFKLGGPGFKPKI